MFKVNHLSIVCSLSLILHLLCRLSAAAPSIVNGDFETGDFSGWTTSGTVSVASDVQYRALAGGVGNWPTGTYVACFGAGNQPDTGGISHTIPTVTNSDYVLTFDYGAFGYPIIGARTQSMDIQVKDGDSLLVLNSLSIADSTPTPVLNDVFDRYPIMFRSIGDSTIISFFSTTLYTINGDGILDNVVVSAVPVPGSIVLGAAGVGVTTWLRRRRVI